MRTTVIRRAIAGIAFLGPFALFAALRLNSSWDVSWANHIFHFYIVSFASLLALSIGLFVLTGVHAEGGQAIFVATAFASMAALFLLHAIATPGMMDSGPRGIGISARLSLSSGAVFLSLAVSDNKSPLLKRLVLHFRQLWIALIALYAIYIALVFWASGVIAALERSQLVSAGLAIFTILLFALAAWRTWRLERTLPSRLTKALLLAIPWLALAQFSQVFAPVWALSWWLYHILMVGAFSVTMGALLIDYEQIRSFSITRYFTFLSVILGVPIVVLLSEAAARLSGSEDTRWPMFRISLLSIGLLIVILLIVIRRAETVLSGREAALQEQKRWRTDFTNLLVHDLKSPLSSVLLSISLIIKGRFENVPEAQKVRLERAQRGLREMTELIDNLLDIEKLEVGDLGFAAATVNLSTLILDSVESVGALAEAYNVHLEATIANELPSLSADPVLLKRVLQNLLTNAIKYTPTDGFIRVDTTTMLKDIVVSVTDTGAGIPLDQRERIFEKFVQGQQLERRGVGLGLAFCKLAVEAHGGRIWVEDGPECGSRFLFTLPLLELKRT